MSEVTPEGLATKIVAEIPNFFRDGFDQLVTGEGEYIRAGEPRGQVGKIGQAVARSYCRQYGANPGAAKFGNAVRIENACRPYLDGIDPDEGPIVKTPFSGGQCPVLYNVSYQTASRNSLVNFCPEFSGPTTRTSLIPSGAVLGPIGAPTEIILPNAQFGNTNRIQSFEVMTGSGLRFISLGGATERFFHTNCGPGWRLSGFAVTRADGQADNCGSPAPIVTQPGPIADPTGPNFRFNPDTGIDIDVGVDILPDGTINVNVGTGPINVDPFPPGAGPGGSDEDPPGDVGEPDETGAEDADENGNASGCAGENQVIGGLKVAILATPPGARVLSPGIFRGGCYIYMGAEGLLDQDFGGSMLRDGQFFLPQKENLTCWEVQANLGYRLRVTPYYKTLEEDGSTTA